MNESLKYISLGSTLIAVFSLVILLLWEKILTKKGKIFKLIQGPLVAVVVGIIYVLFTSSNEVYGISSNQLVSVPIPGDISSFFGQFSAPNFSAITRGDIWITAFTIALVASLETLLCVEATDKLDPEKSIPDKVA